MKGWAVLSMAVPGLFLSLAAAAADFNGDGTDDVSVFRPENGLWAIRNYTRVYFGTAGDAPAPGDYNGDHRDDIAVFRSSSGLWAARNLTRVYYGSSSDLPLGGGSGPWLRNGTGIYYDSGGVGIGTGNPQYKLHLHQNSSSYSYATFTNQSTGSGHLDGVLVGLDATEDFRIHSYESNNVKVYIDDDEKMRIQDNGRVGIGTSSPGAMLHVVGSNNDVGLVLRAGHNGSEPFNDIATFYNADGTLAFWFAAQGAAGANDSWTTFSPYISMHFIPEGCRTEDYNVGDVVAVVDKLAVKTGGAFDVAVIGVICPEEGFISIPKELKRAITQEGKKVDDFGLVPVAYQGDVQVKVNNEGGAIRSGDLLVPSSIPGVAMKGMPENFSQYASVIGKAREDFTGESGLISVSVGVK